jgi:Subtilase family.
MSEPILLDEFLSLPTTIDFVTRQSDHFENYLKKTPEIIATQGLSGGFVLGYIDRNQIDALTDALGSSYISALNFVLGLLDRDELAASGIIQVQDQPFLNLRGEGTIVGIVDTGIDYTKDAFRYEDGSSKIRYIYDQTGQGQHPSGGFLIGTEYTNEQINEALKSENPYEIVPQRDTSGHGTFLASVAAGREEGENIGAAPDAELIVVKLRKSRPFYLERYLIPPDQENAFSSASVMVGIEYIIKRAKELDRPVALCIGVGTNQGSHDGFSLFEDYITHLTNLSGVCICTAAGNESQARHHTQGVIAKTDATQEIEIKVGENAGDIYMTIFNGAADRVSVAVKSPTGERVTRVPAKPGTVLNSRLVLEKSRVTVEYYFPLEGSGGQQTVVKIINATPGVWTVTLYGDIILDGTYHSWLPITGFVSPDVEFLSPIPNFTIVVPATTIGTITCGAYNSGNNSLYPNSSWGPTRLPMMSPTLSAPGVNVGGVYPSGPGVMSGTSVSTGITTGASALLLQWGVVQGNDVAMSTYQIKAFLIRGCNRDENVTYPNPQWGYGRLNLIQSFAYMREL